MKSRTKAQKVIFACIFRILKDESCLRETISCKINNIIGSGMTVNIKHDSFRVSIRKFYFLDPNGKIGLWLTYKMKIEDFSVFLRDCDVNVHNK
jgi:hypothetical protein